MSGHSAKPLGNLGGHIEAPMISAQQSDSRFCCRKREPDSVMTCCRHSPPSSPRESEASVATLPKVTSSAGLCPPCWTVTTICGNIQIVIEHQQNNGFKRLPMSLVPFLVHNLSTVQDSRCGGRARNPILLFGKSA